jgi:hypothetical protein
MGGGAGRRVTLAAAAVLLLLLPVAASAAPVTPDFGPEIEASAAFDPQTTCSPAAKAGTAAFRKLVLDTYPFTGDSGIPRPCDQGDPSEHKEGRAWDWTANVGNPAQRAAVDELIAWLLATDRHGNAMANARRLGLMYMIWNRRIFRMYRPGWGRYTGENPHTGHVHFSFSRAGGRGETSFWRGAPSTAAPGPQQPEAAYYVGAAARPQGGFWLAGRDGGVFSFEGAPFHGSLGGQPINAPVVAMASRASGAGYWLAAADGGVFAFGDAGFHGSMGGQALNAPIVGMAPTPSGTGYWLVARDGGVFAFGDAAFHGSMGGQALNAPIVGMAASPSGGGYWLVASDGGVFSFGDAGFHGSLGGQALNAPIVAMAATPSGRGYWLAAADGGVFTFGDAPFHGSMGAAPPGRPVVGFTAERGGGAYLLMTGDAQVFRFGSGEPLAGTPQQTSPLDTSGERESALFDGLSAPAVGAPARPGAPRLSGLRVNGGRVRFALSRRGAVLFSVARATRVTGRLRFRRLSRSATRAAAQGTNRVRFPFHGLPRGRYRLIAFAVDQAGERSNVTQARFFIRR